jgi:hypothetical protein
MRKRIQIAKYTDIALSETWFAYQVADSDI